MEKARLLCPLDLLCAGDFSTGKSICRTQVPHQSLRAAGSSTLGTAVVPPQTWSLALFLLGTLRQALW
ncbi:unnamed protein product [Rangifer tarandus platyrhynchus]|uniref:Uncharacterized protein n=2 Tax=Rangifer tarandus platyrhynchus TaxID=3082113 RepID=A0ACB0ECW8_RANTA|nr:unnamed protein product [Rangifer tarandus platyrhynchus]CAI9698307.1 unnamed protein product [Rangifer tarandus platyrhynchus]